MENYIYLPIAGLITGLIDSVVGGGGIISLPTLSFAVGAGPDAIGTNKIVGTVGALVALFVYAKNGNLLWKEGLSYVLWCTLGSFLGSNLAPYVEKIYFHYLMIITCPLILILVIKKDKLFTDKIRQPKPLYIFIATAVFAGFYDGFFGPGGGTMMFLGLYLVAGFPLLNAIAISKLANSFSAGTALITYYSNGYVHFREGLLVALGMTMGSFIGATYASKNATKILKPMLILVVTLLMGKLIWDLK